MRLTLFTSFIVLCLFAFSVQAKMFRWVDENGQVHFGDRIPPKYLVKEHDELNQQGIKMKTRAAVKTAEEKIEARRLLKEKRKAELIAKKKKQRDRVLLDTYTTERDLLLARDSRLDAVGSQIKLAENIISDSKRKIDTMEQRITQIIDSKREVPLALYEQLDLEKRQVVVQSRVMQANQLRRDDIAEQFLDYVERFRVLKAEQRAVRERIARERDF